MSNDNSVESKIEKLDKRIHQIETYAKIAIIVGVIFGLTGAWGFNAITVVKKNINEIEDRSTKLQKTISTFETHIKEGINKIKVQEKESITNVQSAKSDLQQAINQIEQRIERANQNIANLQIVEIDISNLEKRIQEIQSTMTNLEVSKSKIASIEELTEPDYGGSAITTCKETIKVRPYDPLMSSFMGNDWIIEGRKYCDPKSYEIRAWKVNAENSEISCQYQISALGEEDVKTKVRNSHLFASKGIISTPSKTEFYPETKYSKSEEEHCNSGSFVWTISLTPGHNQ